MALESFPSRYAGTIVFTGDEDFEVAKKFVNAGLSLEIFTMCDGNFSSFEQVEFMIEYGCKINIQHIFYAEKKVRLENVWKYVELYIDKKCNGQWTKETWTTLVHFVLKYDKDPYLPHILDLLIENKKDDFLFSFDNLMVSVKFDSMHCFEIIFDSIKRSPNFTESGLANNVIKNILIARNVKFIIKILDFFYSHGIAFSLKRHYSLIYLTQSTELLEYLEAKGVNIYSLKTITKMRYGFSRPILDHFYEKGIILHEMPDVIKSLTATKLNHRSYILMLAYFLNKGCDSETLKQHIAKENPMSFADVWNDVLAEI
jgi:hypothetical protein